MSVLSRSVGEGVRIGKAVEIEGRCLMRSLIYVCIVFGALMFATSPLAGLYNTLYFTGHGSWSSMLISFLIRLIQAVIMGLLLFRVLHWFKHRHFIVPARFGKALFVVALAVMVPTILLFAFYGVVLLKGVAVSGIPLGFNGIAVGLSAFMLAYCELPELYGCIPGRRES